jgi:hypothetical protein
MQGEAMRRAFQESFACVAPRALGALCAAFLASGCVAPATTPPPEPTPRAAAPLPLVPRAEIDIAELTQATQLQIQRGERTAMVWWLPEQFWDEALRRQKSPEAMVVAMREVVRPYVVVFALDVAVSGGDAKLTGKSEAELRESLRLRDAQGREYAPIPWSDVSPSATNLLGTMQPLLASMMGKIGENFRPFVFPARDPEGRAIADPLAAGRFTVELAGSALTWQLPLAALIAPRSCPIDSATFNGTFRFCPFHGVELVNP